MKHFSRIFFVIASLVIVILAFLATRIDPCYDDDRAPSSFPTAIIDIALDDITLETLNSSDKSQRFPGTTVSVTANDSHSYLYDDIEIRLRGNSTFTADKKPYQIKFPSRTSLFGLGSSKSWVLLAHYYDPTHLRTYLTTEIATTLGYDISPTGQHIELYIDGEYLGLYYLTPKITTSRLGLDDPTAIVVELDNVHNEGSTYIESTTRGDHLTLADSYADDVDKNTSLLASFTKKFDQAESYLASGDYLSASQIIDMDSFARYLLISEITGNADAYNTSCYFYQANSRDLIHAGPIWDFDLAYGNYHFAPEDIINTTTFFRTNESGYHMGIYGLLYDFPEFRSLVSTIYVTEFRSHLDEIITRLNQKSTKIEDVASRDLDKWYPDHDKSYDDYVTELATWLTSHVEFLDTKMEPRSGFEPETSSLP